ncbi:hypothetical protein GCM10027299_43960 [Larkinella ripae]
MTIRNRLALRFTALVSAILLITFISIYAFCAYFVTSDFYRRLDRKASTYGEMLTRYQLNFELIRQFGLIRKDQLPEQKIIVLDERDSIIFTTDPAGVSLIPLDRLLAIRKQGRQDFRQGRYEGLGIPLKITTPSKPAAQYVVLALAQNVYGESFMRYLQGALIVLFILIAGLTLFSGWLYAGDALRPMKRLDEQLGRIFPSNQDQRLPVGDDGDEISRLSSTINRLLDRISESFRLQRLFVANASHELQNPLTQVTSQLEVSLLNQRDPEAYRQTIRSVLDDVRDLAALTHELLLLSQVSQDQAAGFLTDTVRIDEAIWDIRDEVIALNPRYAVAVDLGKLPDDPDQLTVTGNKTLLSTALKNLAENACKFAVDGRAVVKAQFDPVAIRIEIQNEGPPIPADDLPYLFQPFYRSGQTAGLARGYGIGLSLVERIVRLHGGQISVSSVAGQPILFRVLLPRNPLGQQGSL